MIFKRKKSDDLSSTSNGGRLDEKITSKTETLYVAAMCFVAACLSFMALEVGARSPLGHSVTKSATFNAIFRRSYNLRINILVTNVVMGMITTIMLALGDIYANPYLYVPWLVNTMKGMIFHEGPALLRLSYIWLPDTGIAAGTFVFITFLLFVEELCLWFDILSSFKHCWLKYTAERIEFTDATEKSLRRTKPVDKYGDQIIEHAMAKSKFCNETAGPLIYSTMNTMLVKSTSSDTAIRLRSTRSSNDSKPHSIRSKTTTIVI